MVRGSIDEIVDSGGRRQRHMHFDLKSFAVGALAVVLVALAAVVALWDGQHIEPRDSPTYLAAAVAFAEGGVYEVPFGDRGKPVDFDSSSSPVIDFPPGYPFVLSLGVRAGIAAIDMARALAVVFTAAITALFYWVTWTRSNSRWAGLFVGTIAGLWTLRMSVAVLSEALFGLLISLALVSACIFLRNRSAKWFGVAAVMAVGSVTVRTAGLAVVLAVAVAAWFGFTGRGRRVLWAGATLGAGYYAFAGLVAAGNRVVAWHPPGASSMKITIDAFVSLFVPPVGTPTLRLAAFVLIVGVIAVLARGSVRVTDKGMTPRPELIPLLAAFAQIGLVLATRALFDAQTDLNPRLAYPIALSLLLAGVEYSARQRWVSRRGWLRTGVVVVGGLALLSAGWRTTVVAAELREPDGLRWASASFLESEPVVYLGENAMPASIYSNIPDGLWIAGIAGAHALPTVYDPLSLRPNGELETEIARLSAEVEGGAMIFYDRDSDFGYLVEEPELREVAPCVVVDDGRSVLLSAVDNPHCLG